MTTKTCTVDGCDDQVSGRGFCNKHWQRWKAHGDPLIVKRRAKQAEVCEKSDCDKPGHMRGLCLPHYRELQLSERGPCIIEGCDTPWSANKMCSKHWHRWMRTGSTDDPKPTIRPCAVDGCDDNVRAQELCATHYNNLRRYGNTEKLPKPEKVWLSCIQDNCTELASRKNGMCDRHYRKAIATTRSECREEGCPEPGRHRNGFCRVHGDGLAYQLRRNYNISIEQYNAILSVQHGRCAICRKTPEEAGITRLHVDHDHSCCPTTPTCGKCVRGLLCRCNPILGVVNDDPMLLAAAIVYVTQSDSAAIANVITYLASSTSVLPIDP